MEGYMSRPIRIEKVLCAVFLFSMTVLVASAGCRSAPIAPPAAAEQRPAPRLALGPGDAIDVKFFYVPELNESQTVRPDGLISLQLVGEVPVAGKTPEEVREELFRLYSPHVKRADVTVIVRSFRDRRIYVGGGPAPAVPPRTARHRVRSPDEDHQGQPVYRPVHQQDGPPVRPLLLAAGRRRHDRDRHLDHTTSVTI